VLLFFNAINYSVDVTNFKNGFLVNDWSCVATPLDTNRIAEYEKSLEGEFEFSYKERYRFFGRVNGLCFVQSHLPKTPNALPLYKGSCFDYFDNCWCIHAAIIQYRNKLNTVGHKIPIRKMVNVRRARKSRMWMEAQEHNIETRKKTQVITQSLKADQQHGLEGSMDVITQTQDDSFVGDDEN
jgi:hypothetical protein